MRTIKANCYVIVFILPLILIFGGCASKGKIDNMLTDARYALSEGKYEEARDIYKNILQIDSENRDALYELKDLEKACANKDLALMDTLVDSIASAVFDPYYNANNVSEGDYSLDEYLNLAGEGVKKYVFEVVGVNSTSEISEKLRSTDQNGNSIKGKEIRVGYYDRNTWSVYIPGSYDIGREHIIFGGVSPR